MGGDQVVDHRLERSRALSGPGRGCVADEDPQPLPDVRGQNLLQILQGVIAELGVVQHDPPVGGPDVIRVQNQAQQTERVLQAAAPPHTPPLYAAPPPPPPLSLQAEGFRPPPFQSSSQIFHQRPQFVRRLPPPRRFSMQSFQNRLPSADSQFNFHQRPQFVRRLRQFPTSHVPDRHNRSHRW